MIVCPRARDEKGSIQDVPDGEERHLTELIERIQVAVRREAERSGVKLMEEMEVVGKGWGGFFW